MKNVKKVLLLLCVGAFVSACTLFKPPAYNFPVREGLAAGQQITVGVDDNLYTIAQKYGVKLKEIIVVNKIEPPYRVKAGDRIFLPTHAQYKAPPSSVSVSPYEQPLAQDSTRWLPRPKKRGVTTSPLAPLEPLNEDIVGEFVAEEPAVEPKAKPRPKLFRAPRASSKPVAKAVKVTKAPVKIKKKLPPPQPGVLAFSWPVRGTIISAFGPKGKGRDNDGINIAAPKGAPVKAASAGTVVYADNKMKGFGNLVLVRHKGGWVTAYAHLERVVVMRDKKIAKGAMIGTVGTTGGVASPQLHFEARRDGKPVDPELVVR
ncbi:MAG TPA: hypothetical protein DD400_02540 [Rhodospirillaceae bacterium]|nr:hypothetical protein [Rhodospirillaceae bacterium]